MADPVPCEAPELVAVILAVEFLEADAVVDAEEFVRENWPL